MKNYSELMTYDSYEDRLEYLKLLDNNVTSPRNISRQFYTTTMWQSIRKDIIGRDLGFDLGVFGIYITGHMIIHHIDPITEHDILHMTDKLTNYENLITTSIHTHNLIHYNQKEKDTWTPRKPGDTKLW